MFSQFQTIVLAFVGGIFLAVQGGFNAQLGVQLKSPLMATLVAFICSALFAVVLISLTGKSIPTISSIRAIPMYLWFSGALFSVVGISLYYYSIPRLGMASMISLGLFGQLLFSVIAGHFGWFGMPPTPISFTKVLGVLAMTAGILLINYKS